MAHEEDLMQAVSAFDVEKVDFLLREGADVNYKQPLEPWYDNGINQPDTPLKLVMFRISDSWLEDEDLKKFVLIAQSLVDHGADPLPAMVIAEERYGKYNPDYPDSPFMDVWHIVAKAAQGKR